MVPNVRTTIWLFTKTKAQAEEVLKELMHICDKMPSVDYMVRYVKEVKPRRTQ